MFDAGIQNEISGRWVLSRGNGTVLKWQKTEYLQDIHLTAIQKFVHRVFHEGEETREDYDKEGGRWQKEDEADGERIIAHSRTCELNIVKMCRVRERKTALKFRNPFKFQMRCRRFGCKVSYLYYAKKRASSRRDNVEVIVSM